MNEFKKQYTWNYAYFAVYSFIASFAYTFFLLIFI